MTVFANHNDESPTVYRQEQGQYIYGDSQQLSDLAAFRAAQAAEQAPGFTFSQGNGDGRHQNAGFTFSQGNGDGRHQNAPADGRRHALIYVTEQLPDGRRQLDQEVSFSDMRQPASTYHGGVWRTSSWSESLSVS